MPKSHEKFNPEQTRKFNELMKTAPILDETAELDSARIEWLKKMADLLAETKTSLEDLRTSEGLDKQRIIWWMKQAGIEVYDEKKQ
jgi:hypothetical protein